MCRRELSNTLTRNKAVPMKKPILLLLLNVLLAVSCNQVADTNTTIDYNHMMVRIAELEIEPEYLEEYLGILKEESEASVRLEPGVICIYPMFEKENPTQIRLLEIYADEAAYKAHLQTPHFKFYKESTLPMVKELRLIDMEALSPDVMPDVFSKMTSK